MSKIDVIPQRWSPENSPALLRRLRGRVLAAEAETEAVRVLLLLLLLLLRASEVAADVCRLSLVAGISSEI